MGNQILRQLLNRYNNLNHLESVIVDAAGSIAECYRNGGKVLVCGNGGSASDADHIVGELMKSFEKHRPLETDLRERLKEFSPERGKLLAEKLEQGLPTISLTVHNALITAISNDIGGDMIFAQQVTGIGNKGDVLIGLSTSGNAQNVVDAFIVAKAKGLKTIGMTGETGGKLKKFCDVLINVPETNTANVQELHLPMYHTVCKLIENYFFKKQKNYNNEKK